jgi:demethylmenaquinone methyltransferase/2-methoxy-6-polyprenyl-1,4-benzoquinol methylase
MPDPREVRSMFARISGRYDLLNHLLSLGIDRGWRRAAVRAAGALEDGLVVDVCCGTGDLALEFARHRARVVGVDFTPEMLHHAGPKRVDGERVVFANGDALRLPVRDRSADVVSVAFGVRNLADPVAGLREMARVARPGGLVLVLEFSPPPRGPVGALFRFYFTRVLPLVGGLISGDAEAYRYLPRTVTEWPGADEVDRKLASVGLVECGHRSLSGGVASLHWGRVPEEGP